MAIAEKVNEASTATPADTARFWAVVPAAGIGSRMQADRPKQYLSIQGKTILEHTLERLLGSGLFEAVVVAVSKDDPYWPQLSIAGHRCIMIADGGAERADSVLSALRTLESQADRDDWVLVHDAARPCLTTEDIQALIAATCQDAIGGILAVPVHDTLKGVTLGRIDTTVERSRIWRAMTPQMFRLAALKQALEQAKQSPAAVTDEASALELQGYQPLIVEGRPDNIKVTRPEDLDLAAFYLERILQ